MSGGLGAIIIRRAVADDAPALIGLYRQLDDVHAVAEPDVVPTFAEAPRDLDDIRRTIEAGQRPMWVAVDAAAGDMVIGFAEVRIIELGDLFRFPRVPEVENLAVDERYRGRGIGRQLMRAAEDWARAEGMAEIWVAAWDFNSPAAGLYRSEGFRPLSTRYRKPLHGE
ncbi:MAG TPA: GNAT family N-acetyltransferase [Thermomicrobiales bacterium]|nr:GNAT family N-acetyltransferase [Thermomicrobiales bacterium]